MPELIFGFFIIVAVTVIALFIIKARRDFVVQQQKINELKLKQDTIKMIEEHKKAEADRLLREWDERYRS